MNKYILTVVSVVISTSINALECNSLLEHGLRNIQISQGNEAATKFLYTNHCYKKFDKLSDTQLAEAEAEIFGKGGGSAGYSRDKREERLVDWCKTSKEEAESSSARHNESRLIYDKALQAYTSCNKLAANSIRASIQIAADQTRANFNLRYVGGAISGVQYLGANHEQGFNCTTTGPRLDGDGIIDYSKDFLQNNNVFIKSQAIVINCVRSSSTESREIDGKKYEVLPKATIGIDTAQESFLLDFPEVWPSPGAPVAQYVTLKKELLSKIEQEKSTLLAEIGNTNDAVRSNKNLINSRANTISNSLNSFQSRLSVKVLPIYRGNGAPAGWHRIACGTADSLFASKCPGMHTSFELISDSSGGPCGHSYYIGMCVAK
ncbi:MAG: hypothetical protein JAZ17_04820 [Candidatus Thiodiazotropha endolucinida]|nr:hypothetical protein [Candidatus Thiodiazotropha endolucinida]